MISSVWEKIGLCIYFPGLYKQGALMTSMGDAVRGEGRNGNWGSLGRLDKGTLESCLFL